LNWRKLAFEEQNYKSDISNIGGELNCHHIFPFNKILQTVLTKHKPLLDYEEYYRYAILHDERFYDVNNGLCVTKEEHDLIEQNNLDGHPWWRIWKSFPGFALRNSGLTEQDFLCFNVDGQIDAQNSSIYKSNTREVKNIVRYEHYLGTLYFNQLILISKINNIITGIASFGKGLNKHIGDDTIELTRLCIPYYVKRPFGVEFINKCVNYIKENYPDVKKIISFADPNVGHNGGIYRMAGWTKSGHTKNDYCYFDTLNNKLKHKASCRRIKGLDKSEKELAQERDWIKIPISPKYKYCISCV